MHTQLLTLVIALGLTGLACQSEQHYIFEESATGWRIERAGVSLEVSAQPTGWVLWRGSTRVWASPGGVTPAEFGVFACRLADSSEGYRPATQATLKSHSQDSVVFELGDPEGQALAEWTVRPGAEADWSWELTPRIASPETCGLTFDLPSAGHLYGAGELTRVRIPTSLPTEQAFPLDAGSYERPQFVPLEGSNVITPLWLTATGVALFHDSTEELDLSSNRGGNGWFRVHRRFGSSTTPFRLRILVAENSRAVYQAWVNTHFAVRPDLPVGQRPRDELFARPIWTTWAQYKKAINQEVVLDFADQIERYGYSHSFLEIDDMWTPIYGDLTFRSDTFPDPPAMIAKLKEHGFLVSAWVPPFVLQSARCYAAGVARQAFVGSATEPYPALVTWWDVPLPFSVAVDFQRDTGRRFWGEALDSLQRTTGLDGFKYDAGEMEFLPENADFGGRSRVEYTDAYARFGLAHSGVEMRAGFFSQNLPIAFRQFDKDSSWGLDNGLASVLTQTLAMGLIGYPFVLPDMVGGNEYGQPVSEELFIRWVQLNAFLPMIQFSIPPWRAGFTARANELSLAALRLREELVPTLLGLADEAARSQLPIVRPLFFVFPGDEVSYSIGDQFMLGDRYLVAPVLQPGATTRRVYFPPGRFRALDNPDEIHEGPIWVEALPAPLERIPAFERIP